MTLAAFPFSSAFPGCAVPPYAAILPVALEGLWAVIHIVMDCYEFKLTVFGRLIHFDTLHFDSSVPTIPTLSK